MEFMYVGIGALCFSLALRIWSKIEISYHHHQKEK